MLVINVDSVRIPANKLVFFNITDATLGFNGGNAEASR